MRRPLPYSPETNRALLDTYLLLTPADMCRLRSHKHALPGGTPVAAEPDDVDVRLAELGLVRRTMKKPTRRYRGAGFVDRTSKPTWLITTEGLAICRRTDKFWKMQALARRNATAQGGR